MAIGVFSGGDLEFKSLSRESGLRQQVSEAIRAALISGRMRPGFLYSAPALAESLGVSATPVREAMLDLAREGLVEVARNRGFIVTEVSDAELDELAATRMLLEVPTMGAIAENCDRITAGLHDLRELALQLEQAAETHELIAYMQLDTEFHSRFLTLGGNATLVSLVRSLRNRSRLYGLERLAQAGGLVESTREHAAMIDLGIAGDRHGLEALTRQHIGHIRTVWAYSSPIKE
jgi:DNA-binding GntR family transcriptional regulator